MIMAMAVIIIIIIIMITAVIIVIVVVIVTTTLRRVFFFGLFLRHRFRNMLTTSIRLVVIRGLVFQLLLRRTHRIFIYSIQRNVWYYFYGDRSKKCLDPG